MTAAPGTTPGLRIPLRAQGAGSFVLVFGSAGEKRYESVTAAQLMTLLTDAAREIGLSLSHRPPPGGQQGATP
ncbi:hypothetical protein GCM10022245_32470 [Streptomyces mayteni]